MANEARTANADASCPRVSNAYQERHGESLVCTFDSRHTSFRIKLSLMLAQVGVASEIPHDFIQEPLGTIHLAAIHPQLRTSYSVPCCDTVNAIGALTP